jgi:DNA modification methylase
MTTKTHNPADKVERWPIDKLVPYARNARTHSDEQVGQIAASIKEWGWTTPILVDETGSIIAGHGRTLAAQRLQMTEVPVMVAKGWSEAKKRAYVLADNKLAMNAGWDNEMLALELGEIGDLGFDLDLTGFTAEEIAALTPDQIEPGLTDEDAVPEVPVNPVTVFGDVWILGKHRLMCGDSTSIDAVEVLMAGQKADMVFTDPPYGMHLDTDWSSAKSSLKFASEKNALGGKKHRQVIGDHDDFTPELINTVFACFDYCKEIFLWGADYYAEHLPRKNDGSWVVWDKRLDESADKMYGSTFELCWSKARHKRMLARVKWAGIFGTEQEFDRKRHHPTQKPVKLVEWFFDYYSMKDKIIIADIYGGAGGTLIACEKTNRICCMMELDPKYCDVIVKRWQDFTGKIATHAETGTPFAEVHNDSKT